MSSLVCVPSHDVLGPACYVPDSSSSVPFGVDRPSRMPSTRTTDAQLRRGLQYQSGAQPAFLRALQARISGKPDPSSYGGDEDEDGGGGGEWEQLDENRPAIPKRPAADPEHDGRNRANEDDDDDDEAGDEAPTVVVLRKGKHLTQEEVKNEKRKAKGLPLVPPEPERAAPEPPSSDPTNSPSDPVSKPPLSTPGVTLGARKSAKRRTRDDNVLSTSASAPATSAKPAKKKAKKESKSLISFGDD